MKLIAPAKINLVLRVLGKRDDGYHELETWMQKIGLHDEIFLQVNDSANISLQCNRNDIPVDRSNLVWRAAELFFSKSLRGRRKGASISLIKNIPVAAGLGGGSSDAGAVLRGLNSYFEQEFSKEELIDMAVSLGADVPFFVIEQESVLATGIGEKMQPVLPLRNCMLILVNPGVSVSTAEIFTKYGLTRVEKNSTLTGSRKLRADDLHLHLIENDLESVTIDSLPVVGEIKAELRKVGATHVLMSGSGPTVFGVFQGDDEPTQKIVEKAVSRLRDKFGEKFYIIQSQVGV